MQFGEDLNERYGIVGKSDSIRIVWRLIEQAAPTDTSVLILGETGTGTELIAHAIHDLSPRREQTFVPVCCAAVPAGLLENEFFGHERSDLTGTLVQQIGCLERAHQGTLFLVEVGDIPLQLQPKLLQALQTKQFQRAGGIKTILVDVRLVSATNCDLDMMVSDGRFRSELYDSLRAVTITVPPLRDRKEDIPLLVHHFSQELGGGNRREESPFSPEAMELLSEYDWPGNVRQLKCVVETSIMKSPGSVIQPECLPETIKPRTKYTTYIRSSIHRT